MVVHEEFKTMNYQGMLLEDTDNNRRLNEAEEESIDD